MNTHLIDRRAFLRRALQTAGVLTAAALTSRQTAHAGVPKLVVTEPLAWLRNAPNLLAGNTVAVRNGEFYEVIARSSDMRWLQLSVPSAGGRGTWLYAALGAPADRSARAFEPLPVRDSGPLTPKLPKKPVAFPPWVPRITPQQRAIYQRAIAAGKDAGMFTVVGDCNSQPPVYVRRVANGEFDSSRVDPRIQIAVNKFAKSFGHVSLAAKGGFGTAAMLDPLWTESALCDATLGPFECEIAISRASVVFIELGTGDQLAWQAFEKNYTPLVALALKKGVLPVLVTKADDIETSTGATPGFINAIVRKTAADLQVPLLDFYAATRNLPNQGLLDEGDKDFHLNDAGIYRHLEGTLQTLSAIAG